MVFYSLQAGLYEDATTLATECLDLVNKELEKANDPNVEKVDLQSKEKALIQLMHLYGHLAEIETTVDISRFSCSRIFEPWNAQKNFKNISLKERLLLGIDLHLF